MKKIAVLASLPLIALASCGKEDNQKKEVVNNTPVNGQNQNNNAGENAALNENISSGATSEAGLTRKEFNLTYNLPDGRPLEFKGNLEIENGLIKSINFPEYDLTNDATYEVKFAKKMQADLIGKQIKGLQYDGMSGASLTTNAFNEYLNTINK